MFRTITACGLVLALSSSAAAEDAPDRPLEVSLVISPTVITGKTGKAAGEFKDDDVTHKKIAVEVADVLRAPKGGPRKGATVTVYSADPPKAGVEQVMCLGAKDKNGYRLHLALGADEADEVKKLVAFEARAEKELDGKAKLRAAFFAAHKLRPVLRAAAEERGVKVAGAMDAKTKDKLLAILAWSMKECSKKKTKAEFKELAEALRRVLTGHGGLPEIKTRKERMVQYLASHLANPKVRAKYPLQKLAVTDADARGAVAARRVVAVRQVGGQILIARPGLPEKKPEPEKKPAPKPKLPASLEESAMGRPVDGVALHLDSAKPTYNVRVHPDEPVRVTARFRNTGQKPLTLNTYMLFSMLAQVYIVDPGGKVIVHQDKSRLDAPELPAMGTWSFRELKPGRTLEFTEDIPTTSFHRTGEYKLCMVYKNPYGRQFGLRNAWTGELVSQQVAVTILRDKPAPEPPEPETKPEPPEKKAEAPAPGQDPGIRTVHIQVQAVGGAVQKRVIINGNEVRVNAVVNPGKPAPKKDKADDGEADQTDHSQ
jgi:hypothetical protein